MKRMFGLSIFVVLGLITACSTNKTEAATEEFLQREGHEAAGTAITAEQISPVQDSNMEDDVELSEDELEDDAEFFDDEAFDELEQEHVTCDIPADVNGELKKNAIDECMAKAEELHRSIENMPYLTNVSEAQILFSLPEFSNVVLDANAIYKGIIDNSAEYPEDLLNVLISVGCMMNDIGKYIKSIKPSDDLPEEVAVAFQGILDEYYKQYRDSAVTTLKQVIDKAGELQIENDQVKKARAILSELEN